MRRYLPLIALIIIGLAIAGWQLSRGGKTPAPPPLPMAPTGKPAQPLQPPPAYLQAAAQFLTAWSKDDAAGSYGLLSAGMKKAATQAAWGDMLRGAVFTNPESVAHVGTVKAAYAIYRVQAQPRAQGEPALAGFALLLLNEGGAWRVGSVTEQEKMSQKYEGLRLSPSAKGGWTVTYADEKGEIMTVTLPAM